VSLLRKAGIRVASMRPGLLPRRYYDVAAQRNHNDKQASMRPGLLPRRYYFVLADLGNTLRVLQ